MNVYEMKKALVEICDNISPKDCMAAYCPLCEVCTSSQHIPKIMEDAEIITMYNEAARQGIIGDINVNQN